MWPKFKHWEVSRNLVERKGNVRLYAEWDPLSSFSIPYLGWVSYSSMGVCCSPPFLNKMSSSSFSQLMITLMFINLFFRAWYKGFVKSIVIGFENEVLRAPHSKLSSVKWSLTNDKLFSSFIDSYNSWAGYSSSDVHIIQMKVLSISDYSLQLGGRDSQILELLISLFHRAGPKINVVRQRSHVF